MQFAIGRSNDAPSQQQIQPPLLPIVSLIVRAFCVLYFCQLTTVSTQQQPLQVFPLVAVPWPLFSPTFVAFDSHNECDDRRPDCAVFRDVCDHPDYKQLSSSEGHGYSCGNECTQLPQLALKSPEGICGHVAVALAISNVPKGRGVQTKRRMKRNNGGTRRQFVANTSGTTNTFARKEIGGRTNWRRHDQPPAELATDGGKFPKGQNGGTTTDGTETTRGLCGEGPTDKDDEGEE